MRHILLFENFIPFVKISNVNYKFNDGKGNDYSVYFTGPYDSIDGKKTGITYDLEFFTQDNNYKTITNVGIPFTVTNYIFNDILKDFIKKNKVDTINIDPVDVEENVTRYSKKKDTRYKLYLRSIKQTFSNDKNWSVYGIEDEDDDKKIIIINRYGFWKNNDIKKINELVVITDINKNKRNAENILDIPTNQKSRSSMVLLNKDLKDNELYSIFGFDVSNIKRSILYYYQNKVSTLHMLLNNLNFLKSKLKENGSLTCEYCKKNNLVIYDTFTSKRAQVQNTSPFIKYERFSKKDGATCDHRNPRSKGGSVYDLDNLAVCCYKCNIVKNNMLYKDWLERVKNDDIDNEDNAFLSLNNKILNNKIFIMIKSMKNKFIKFRVKKEYNYLNIDQIVKKVVLDINKNNNAEYSVSLEKIDDEYIAIFMKKQS